jgi:putative endonuclease
MSQFQPCTYIMASGRRGYIYIGVTSNLLQRVQQHRDRLIDGYSKNRNTVHRVRFELFGAKEQAIGREKQLKNWHRDWKFNLVESDNPDWLDLAAGLGLGPLD